MYECLPVDFLLSFTKEEETSHAYVVSLHCFKMSVQPDAHYFLKGKERKAKKKNIGGRCLHFFIYFTSIL